MRFRRVGNMATFIQNKAPDIGSRLGNRTNTNMLRPTECTVSTIITYNTQAICNIRKIMTLV